MHLGSAASTAAPLRIFPSGFAHAERPLSLMRHGFASRPQDARHAFVAHPWPSAIISGASYRGGPTVKLHPSRGGGGRPHEGHAQAQLELQGSHPEARPNSRRGGGGHEVAAKDDARSDRRGAADGVRVEAPRCAREEPLRVGVGRTCGSKAGRSFAGPTEPARAPYEVGRCAGPACPERLTAKSFARWANEPSSRSKPSVRPAASAPTSATSGRIEATLARFVRRGRDRRLPKHRMGLILAGACPTHRRSAKAKGLAVASHRAAATP